MTRKDPSMITEKELFTTYFILRYLKKGALGGQEKAPFYVVGLIIDSKDIKLVYV